MVELVKYREPEVNWIGQIPDNWKIKRIKDLTSVISKGTTPSTEGEGYVDQGVRFIKAENLKHNGTVGDFPQFFISEETNEKLKRSKLKHNDILICIAGATTGKVALIEREKLPANTNQAVCFLRLRREEKGKAIRFKYYFLVSKSFQDLVWTYAVTSAQPNLSMAVLGRIEICYPPHRDQIQIASFLDSKTKAIDKKIELLQEKIAIYKEYRNSLIIETVTRGLNKKVSLRDSGIEWIGKIPEHWEVKRFKYFAKTIKGKSLINSEKPFDKSLPLVTLEYLRNESVQHPTFAYSTDSSLQTTAEDFIIVWDGAAVGEILKAKEGYLSSTIAKIKINKKLYDPKYFYHLRDFIDYTIKQIPTGMGIPHLNPNLLKNFKCPYPPLEEQSEIAEFLDSKTETIDKIVDNIKKQIKTLKELRKTLINDVVTGKIKVTG